MNPSHDLLSRRNLIKTTAAAAGAAAIAGLDVQPAAAREALQLREGATVLFQGDSITDAGRDRKTAGNANNFQALGRGYPLLLAHALLADHAQSKLKVYNRGISGNKVPDLDGRWQADCLDLKPNVLSVLIGVNDVWHRVNGQYDGTIETYRNDYRALLARTQAALPDVKLVVCEPFVLRCGAVTDAFFPAMDEVRAAATEICREFDACFVPFQAVFDTAAKLADKEYWLRDGVHPTTQGAALMAGAWLRATGAVAGS
ncbi:MAG: SGNH/GDSL hydrolase family protein [Planctomycetales bacterium]|nr:SGNH/GDSL hydrolase family protein [Planctomycetales bacterium]